MSESCSGRTRRKHSLIGTVRERRLDSHRHAEAERDLGVSSPRGAQAPDREPEQAVVGRRGEPVEERIERRAPEPGRTTRRPRRRVPGGVRRPRPCDRCAAAASAQPTCRCFREKDLSSAARMFYCDDSHVPSGGFAAEIGPIYFGFSTARYFRLIFGRPCRTFRTWPSAPPFPAFRRAVRRVLDRSSRAGTAAAISI